MREQLEDLVDLILETAGQHLIGFVKAEDLDGVCAEGATVDHVEHTSGSTHNDVGTVLELRHVLTDVRAADARMALDVHVVAQSDNDLLDLLCQLTRGRKDKRLGALDRHVEFLEDGNRECRGLARAGLRLRNDVVTFDDGDDSALLDGRRALKTVRYQQDTDKLKDMRS